MPTPASSDSSADWTVITVTYNSTEQLKASWPGANIGAARWIVVDNASADDSVGVAQELGAEVVRLPVNVGFGAANNVALADVSTPYTLFVNPDIAIASPGDLDRLAAVSRANEDAFVAPQLLNPDGSRQPNARGLPFLVDKIANRSVKLPTSRLEDYVRTGFSQPTYVAWVIGAAIGGPTNRFQALGGWDEQFFIYYEDHDLPLRGWLSGTPTILDPAVTWQHEWQRATTRPSLTPWKHEFRGMRRFYRKYPELLTRRREGRSIRFDTLRPVLWRPATDPG